MSVLQFLIFLAVSFGASAVGAVCGLGGGVIIKPVLDLMGCASAQTISFLSGCTVLAMTCYSVGKSVLTKEHRVQFAVGTPLAAGGCIGGVIGKQIYTTLGIFLAHQNIVGAIQSALQSVLPALALMIAGGILGGMAGRQINKRIDNAAVKKLYMSLMIVIIGICVFNTWKYLT